MAQAVIVPKRPLLPAQLGEWDGTGDPEVEIDRAAVRGADISGERLSVDGSRLERCSMIGAAYDACSLTDVECVRLEAAGVHAYKANLLRVAFADCRCTGAEFAEARFEDCAFKNVKFDEAGFRFATLTRVRFESCLLRQADFANARLHHVTFTGCDFEGADFTSAVSKNVDIRGEDITQARGVLGLKGATISTEQLIQLATLLASELGFTVES
jgi:uncharacterized protein YjbI with pentapeptide repeats